MEFNLSLYVLSFSSHIAPGRGNEGSSVLCPFEEIYLLKMFVFSGDGIRESGYYTLTAGTEGQPTIAQVCCLFGWKLIKGSQASGQETSYSH